MSETPIAKLRRLLIIEDEQNLASNIAEYFEAGPYDLDFAGDGLTALHLLSHNTYDLVVLDLMLPGVSGYEICRRIRRDLNSDAPVIMTTAKGTLADKEHGFDAGADDYLVKPFDLRELELRIEALLRRGRFAGQLLKAGNIVFDPDRLQIILPGYGPLELSGISARLFEALIRAYPKFLDHELLSEEVWGRSDTDTHTLRTQIYSLRQQIQRTFGVNLIHTVHGRGYRLEPDIPSRNAP